MFSEFKTKEEANQSVCKIFMQNEMQFPQCEVSSMEHSAARLFEATNK